MTHLLIGDMHTSTRVAKLFGQSKVNDVYEVCRFPDAHDKVGGFDVTVNEIA